MTEARDHQSLGRNPWFMVEIVANPDFVDACEVKLVPDLFVSPRMLPQLYINTSSSFTPHQI